MQQLGRESGDGFAMLAADLSQQALFTLQQNARLRQQVEVATSLSSIGAESANVGSGSANITSPRARLTTATATTTRETAASDFMDIVNSPNERWL